MGGTTEVHMFTAVFAGRELGGTRADVFLYELGVFVVAGREVRDE